MTLLTTVFALGFFVSCLLLWQIRKLLAELSENTSALKSTADDIDRLLEELAYVQTRGSNVTLERNREQDEDADLRKRA